MIDYIWIIQTWNSHYLAGRYNNVYASVMTRGSFKILIIKGSLRLLGSPGL